MVVLKPPPIPKLDHPVPWIKTRFQEELAQAQSGSIEPGTEPHKDLEVEDDPR